MRTATRILVGVCAAVIVPVGVIGAFYALFCGSLILAIVILPVTIFASADLFALCVMEELHDEPIRGLIRKIRFRIRFGNHDISRMEPCD